MMERVREGDSASLGVLFERHRGSLFGSFVRRTGDPTLSEDLVQDTFMRAFRYRKSFRGGQPFLPWLHRIARNVLYAALKRRGVAVNEDGEPGELLADTPCPRPLPDQLSAVSTEREILYEALEQLPEPQRQLIVLRRIQNLDYDEIATLLDCEVAPLKVRVHRAFLKLQRIVVSLTEVNRL